MIWVAFIMGWAFGLVSLAIWVVWQSYEDDETRRER